MTRLYWQRKTVFCSPKKMATNKFQWQQQCCCGCHRKRTILLTIFLAAFLLNYVGFLRSDDRLMANNASQKQHQLSKTRIVLALLPKINTTTMSINKSNNKTYIIINIIMMMKTLIPILLQSLRTSGTPQQPWKKGSLPAWSSVAGRVSMCHGSYPIDPPLFEI